MISREEEERVGPADGEGCPKQKLGSESRLHLHPRVGGPTKARCSVVSGRNQTT